MQRINLSWFLSAVALLCVVGLLPSGAVLAQITQLPGAVEPGRKTPPRLALPPAPTELEWSIELPPGAVPPKSLLAEKLTLTDLMLDGVTVYKREELADLFKHYLGKEITFGQFYDISRAIQLRYRKDGYILSFSYIPPQTVENDVFRIAVVEGYVERVVVTGVAGRLKQTLEQSLAPITRSRPLNIRFLERYLLEVNDLAGIKVTGVLRPSRTTRGATVLEAKVRRGKLFGAGASFDNRSSEFTGPWTASTYLTVNSPFGTGERFNLAASEASRFSELVSVTGSYQQPIGTEGLRFDLLADYSKSNPGFTLEAFDVETKSLEFTGDLTYPVIKSRSETLHVGGGFTFRNSAVDLLGELFNRDRIRLARANLNYSRSGFLGGASRAVLALTQALPILAATDPDEDTTSRADSDPYFSEVNLDISHAQHLYRGFGLRITATGQYATDPTPASEEFSVGGESYGRAYDSGEITGEDGFAFSVELNYDVDFKIPSVRYVQPYGFYDFGKVWDKRSASSAGLVQSIASAGFGFRVGVIYGLSLHVEYAYPLRNDPSNQNGEKHGRLFFFTSWSY